MEQESATAHGKEAGAGEACELLHLAPAESNGAPPLLFIHGGFHGAWCWADHFIPWFAERGYDCHAVSYREHGGNPRTARHGEWRLRDYVDDVRDARDRIGVEPILVGHSLGGSIAQKLAAEGGCRGLVLIAPSPIGGSNRAALRMFASHPGAMIRAFGKGDLAGALPAFMSFFLSDAVAPEERARIAARCDGQTSMRAANDAFYFDSPKPRDLGIPVLVASGALDWSIPRYKNDRLARAYGGEHVVVPTAHDVMCDAQWEAAATQVEAWLRRRFLA